MNERDYRYWAERKYARNHPRIIPMWAWVIVIVLGLCVVAVLLSSCMPIVAETITPSHTEYAPVAVATPTMAKPEKVRLLPTPTAPRCIVSTGYKNGTVNVRSGPGMIYPVIDVVYEGQELPLYGQAKNGWQKVCTPQLIEGWFYVERWCEK